MTNCHNQAEQLRSIKTLPSLVRYLRDELEWPVESDDFDDLVFDYEPEELGIDPKAAVKVGYVKQLRPPGGTLMPWGVFFVSFKPGSLPVVILRRILRALALKRRPHAGAAERPAWRTNDLLFISSYGVEAHRDIAFAHFAEKPGMGDLPVLHVLGWDNRDTVAHLDHAATTLGESLRWPDDPRDLVAWRTRWSEPFTLRHREVVTTSRQLAVELARVAAATRDRVAAVMRAESKRGALTKLAEAVRKSLVHDMKDDDFADMYAQTMAYGLLTARFSRPEGLIAENFSDMVPPTNPFLRELSGEFLKAAGRTKALDFDELGINDLVELLRDANMEAVLRDFDDRNPQEDPVIHFYELFLKEYDPKKRTQRGVFYTPRPVVSYIVRSVDELLRTEFGLEDGLADTATWGEMAKRHPDLTIPKGVASEQDFVQILDPATGTGTFLVEVIDVIHNTLTTKWKAQGHNAGTVSTLWNEYVPKHLLTRMHGYELLMAPYAIAHLKIGLRLHEKGYRFASDERARVYLTNALEPAQDYSDQFDFGVPALAHEAAAVDEVKREAQFTVVIGNPPYSLLSANLEPHHRAMVEDYKFVSGVRMRERGALQMEKNLNDDYVKFIRLTQLLVDRVGIGVSGLITNHSFLDNPTMRGVRWSLLRSASQIWLNDLHGNSTKQEQAPDGCEDENIFQIKQGVAIALSVRLPRHTGVCMAKHHELWGKRQNKEVWLGGNHAGTHEWRILKPTPEHFLFIPQDGTLKSEFNSWPCLPDVMPANGAGYITARDNLVIDFNRKTVIDRIRLFNASRQDDSSLLKRFEVAEKKGWDVRRARAELKHVDVPKRVIETNYRPLDSRWIFYDSTLVWGRSWPTMQHVVGHARNLTMLATRMTKDQWDVWVARTVSSHKAMSAYDTNSVFPLYLIDNQQLFQRGLANGQHINFTTPFLKSLANVLDLQHETRHGLPSGITPEDIFHYTYAVFRCPTYRTRYAEFLKIDFPRLPLTSSLELFRALAKLGGELVALHLMESPKLDKHITKWVGGKDPEVEKVTYSDETVWIDKAQSEGFRGVPENVWIFRIGGYQVCEKWLKDRKGRTLSADDITHYHRIVVALNETIRLMAEIDEVIEQHGGWPGAFVTEPLPEALDGGGTREEPAEFGSGEFPLAEDGADGEAPPPARSARRRPTAPPKRAETVRPRAATSPRPAPKPAESSAAARTNIDACSTEDMLAAIRRAAKGLGWRETGWPRGLVILEAARELGFARTGSRINEALESALRTAVRRGVVTAVAGKIWQRTNTIDDYLNPDADPYAELRRHLRAAIGKVWTPDEEAIRATARHIGFQKAGKNISAALRSTLRSAIRRGELERAGPFVRAAR